VRILLVEDDPKNVELFQAALEDEHEVVVERDGVAGQERALDEVFDLILLDIQLPKRSGIEVCRRLRASGLRTPIVALSASVLPDEIARTKDAEFSRFLSKPIAPRALRAAVRELVDPLPTQTRAAGSKRAGGAAP
jgi:CheY-like chemotaxis protein